MVTLKGSVTAKQKSHKVGSLSSKTPEDIELN